MPYDPKVHESEGVTGKARCGRSIASYRGDLPTTTNPQEVTCRPCRRLGDGCWGIPTGQNSGRRGFGEIRVPGSHTRQNQSPTPHSPAKETRPL